MASSTGRGRAGTRRAWRRYGCNGPAILALIEIGATNTEDRMFKFLRNAFILREIWRMFRRGRRV
jgi:hypothetical protein